MNIRLVSFGSLWSVKSPGETICEKAIFNTTGFMPGKLHPGKGNLPATTIKGRVRFDRAYSSKVGNYEEEKGAIYESPGFERFDPGDGWENRVLFRHRQNNKARVDAFLVRIDSRIHGRIDFSCAWKTRNVKVIAASSRGQYQETLVLMGPNGKITTSIGVLELSWLIEHSE
jgi:hypothetical protein